MAGAAARYICADMKIQFTEIECKDMMFNPLRIPDGMSIFEFYPQLNKYKIFKKSAGKTIDNHALMLWVIFMYDKNTPYRLKFKDVLKRKIAIANDVGFETIEGGRFEQAVDTFLKGQNTVVNAKIVEYVRLHREFKYTYLVGIENSYYQIMDDVMRGETKRISELREVQQELEDTMIDLMNQDDNQHVRDMVLRFMEAERLELRPEDIALKLLKGEQAVTADEIWE